VAHQEAIQRRTAVVFRGRNRSQIASAMRTYSNAENTLEASHIKASIYLSFFHSWAISTDIKCMCFPLPITDPLQGRHSSYDTSNLSPPCCIALEVDYYLFIFFFIFDLASYELSLVL